MNDEREEVMEEESSGSSSGSGESENNEETESTTVYVSNSVDYSGYFENIQVIGIVICSLIVAYGVFNAFIHGVLRK